MKNTKIHTVGRKPLGMFLSLYDAFKHLPSERAVFENRCIDLAMNKPIIRVYSFEEIDLLSKGSLEIL